ncbi:S9 family peptidase [Wenjunlia tyrosinilytica]|uniref:Peptidase S9 n=1 Tax=Wenjunlia tyrosinilytica TaxID=1544741 RepID=A0A917ZTB8_9ACTN|nr:alpha/beta fold hydrolase [Wenjunlia tyrosinilytica]GGO89641.1 peptidase S9 [Wenjunlia tyrosinilytica]
MADATAFHDLSAFVALPRIAGLALSPDGTRLITSAAELSRDGTRYVPALWEVDPAGEREAVRLTRSESGESAPAFAPDGSLLFLSERAVPDSAEDDKDREEPAIWRLPVRGEAERVLTRAGGIGGFAVAESSGHIAFAASLLTAAQDSEDDARRREAREKAKVSAILHDSGPVRYWDVDLGPGVPHVFVARPGADSAGAPVDAGARGQIAEGIAASPDGSLIAYTAYVGQLPQDKGMAVVIADASSGKRLHVLESPDHEFSEPAFTPDGRAVVCLRFTRPTWEASGNCTLWRFGLGDCEGSGRDLTPDFDQWPTRPVVARTGEVFFTADEFGHSPVFRLSPDGEVTRLTASGAYGDVVVSADGGSVYALRNTVDSPPVPVRLRADAGDQEPVRLKAPGADVELPGTLTEVHTTADDGAALRGWLVLPDAAAADRPAPLLVFVHGGPQTSWNSWHWRWNPWNAAARGYAVLMPDPALSTGYGQHHHQRGWSGWGQQPYRDVMALTDATVARDDIDEARTGLLGGSYGGYMANWVAGQTDRFRAIVSHASLWNLPGFAGDTDSPAHFTRIFGDPLERTERYEENSPHLHAKKISTPMLVIHGARDYRVPVGEAMALWHDLLRFEVPAKYLYFPDENHWILSPNNAKVWYETVLNFVDHHVLDKEWVRPALL